MHTLEDRGEHFKELLMFPDYTASGLWCSCGLGLGDPQAVTSIPYNLVKMIEFWNDQWDLASTCASREEWSEEAVEYYRKEIVDIGRILCEQVGDIISCKLLEDRCKLNIVNHNW